MPDINFRITQQPLRNTNGLFWLLIDKAKDSTPGRISSDDLISWIKTNVSTTGSVSDTGELWHSTLGLDSIMVYNETTDEYGYRLNTEFIGDIWSDGVSGYIPTLDSDGLLRNTTLYSNGISGDISIDYSHKFIYGTDGLYIYNNDIDSYIDGIVGNIYIKQNNDYALSILDNNIHINKKLYLNNNYLYFGDDRIANYTMSSIYHVDNIWTFKNESDYSIVFNQNGSDALSIGSSALSIERNVELPYEKHLSFGDNSDLKIYHNGTNSYISNILGNIYISQGDTDAMVINNDYVYSRRYLYLVDKGLFFGNIALSTDVPHINYIDNNWIFQNKTGSNFELWGGSSLAIRSISGGKTGFKITPTATVHIYGGNHTIGSAPLKIDSGKLLTITEAGAIENDGSYLYYTIDGGVRYKLNQTSGIGLLPSGTDCHTIYYNGTTGLWTSNGSVLWNYTNSIFSIAGSILLNNNQYVDVVSSVGVDVLNIGTSNADTINIGWSGATINIQGTLLWQQVDNLQVKDKLITLNKGGGVDSGTSTGFEIEENTVVKGYFTTDGTREGWILKPPAIGYEVILKSSNITNHRTFQFPNQSGTLSIQEDNDLRYLAFKTIGLTSDSGYTWGSSNVVSGLYNDTLSVVAGAGIVLYTDATHKAIKITNTITQYTDALARQAISLTTNNHSGQSTYSNSTGVFNIPEYTLSGLGGQPQLDGNGFVVASGTTIGYDSTIYTPTARLITINGVTYDLSSNRAWVVNVGSSGYSSNVYLTNLTSTTVGSYKQLSYSNELTTTTFTADVTSGSDTLIGTFIFDTIIGISYIDAGAWGGAMYSKINNTSGITNIRFDVFSRTSGGTETTLFTGYSNNILNTSFENIQISSTQEGYSVNTTDKIGVRIYAHTTSGATITVSLQIGDNTASWISTPLKIRHTQLRDLEWTLSAHTGTASTLAGFDTTGLPTNYTESNYLLTSGSRTGATSQSQTFTNGIQVGNLTASKVVFTDASKNLTSTGIGTSSHFIKGDGSLDSNVYLTGTKVDSFNTRTGVVTLTSTDVTTALTFTPYNATNPSGYIPLTALSSTATGLTYTNTTGVFSLTSGYVIPTTTQSSNWNTAYGWGNHAGLYLGLHGTADDANLLDGYNSDKFAGYVSGVEDIHAIGGQNLYTFFSSTLIPTNSPVLGSDWVSGVQFPWVENGDYRRVLATTNSDLFFGIQNGGTWLSWRKLYDTGNFVAGTDYQVPLSGIIFSHAHSLLSAATYDGWLGSSKPKDYYVGLQISHVKYADGFQNYGTVLTGLSENVDAGGAFQIYTPASPSFGGTGMQIRFGNWDAADHNDWTNWKTIWDNENLTNPITGIGTVNYIPKFTGAGTLGNSPMYTDGTNVGIGMSPNQKLDVAGNINIGSGGYLYFGNGDAKISTTTNGTGIDLLLSTYDTDDNIAERVRITKDGNAGFGTPDPTTSIDVVRRSEGLLARFRPHSDVVTIDGEVYISVGHAYGVKLGQNYNNGTCYGFLEIDGGTRAVQINKDGSTVLGGALTINSINNAGSNMNKNLVSNSGVITFRTNAELLSDMGAISGTGTSGYMSKFTGASTVGNSLVQDDGTYVAIGMTPSTYKFSVNGTGYFATSIITPTAKFSSGATSGYFWSCTNVDGSGAWTSFSGAIYRGEIDGDTGVPIAGGSALIDGTGTTGWYYACSDAGTYDYGNPSGNSLALAIGDQIYYNGTQWIRVPGAGSYVLPIATTSALGGIQIGSGISIDGSGKISVSTAYEPTNAVSTHAALRTGVHGLDISAGVTLTVTLNASVSNTNTGDETTSTIKTKLGAADTDSDGYLTYTDWNKFNTAYGWGNWASNFGSISGKIAEGNHTHSIYLPLAGGTIVGNVIFNDDVKLSFGNSGISDSQIYWASTNGLYYKSSSYHGFWSVSGTKQFETTSLGVNIPTGSYYINDVDVIANKVVGPSSSVDGYVCLFDGITGKLIKTGTGTLGSAAYTASSSYIPSVLTTKGDMLVRTTSGYDRLAISATNGYVLTVDSGFAGGMKWAAPASGMSWPSSAGIAVYSGSSSWGASITDSSTHWNDAYTHTSLTNNPHSVSKLQLNLGNVENTALSTWAGSSYISSVGTITSGVWQSSTPVGVGYGGTGLNYITPGQIPSGNGVSAFRVSSNLFWDYANNRLGVGTSSPQTTVHFSNATTGEVIRITNTGTISGAGYQGPKLQFSSYNEVGVGPYLSGSIQSIWMAAGNKFDLYLGGASGGSNVTCARFKNDGTTALNGNVTFEAGIGFSGGSLITKIATNGTEVYNSDTEVPTSNAVFNSPQFYGAPLSTTPANFYDETTKIATTAWTWGAIRYPGTINTLSASGITVFNIQPASYRWWVYSGVNQNLTINASSTSGGYHGLLAVMKFVDAGTSKSITFGTGFRTFKPVGVATPITTAGNSSKCMYVRCRYDSVDDKWDVIDWCVQS